MLKKSLFFATLLVSFATQAAPLTPADGFMVVNADGTVARATKGYAVDKFDTGSYEISYVASMHNCAYSITEGTSDATVPAQGFATIVGRQENQLVLEVSTYDASGHLADRGFHLIVRC
jgi:hypothetical protein